MYLSVKVLLDRKMETQPVGFFSFWKVFTLVDIKEVDVSKFFVQFRAADFKSSNVMCSSTNNAKSRREEGY